MIVKIIKLLVIIVLFLMVYYVLKNRKKILGKYKWIKRKYKRKIVYLRRKYYTQENDLKRTITFLLGLIIYILMILLFLKYIDVIEFKEKNIIPILHFEKINIEKYCYEFLWAQISASLIVSTVISLLSIFSTTYIYGKKQINVIFNKNSIFSLGKMFIYLVILIFVSLAICLREANYYVILISFIITLSIVFYMLFKIMIFYTHPFFFKESVKSDYIKREKKHIRKAKPLESHGDIEIKNLKEVTIAMIQKNDNDYNININAIMNMIETSLLSNPKNIQEYYTEMIERTDFISSILEIITHLIKCGKISEANHLMSQLYSRLKYYRIVLIQDYFSYSIILDLINNGKYIENEREALEHFRVLWNILKNNIYFIYLYNCELDLSYCRLGKSENLIYYITHNDYLEKMYLSVRENKLLSQMEKERIYDQLYDDIRMMEFREEHPEQDIRHYWNDELNKEKIKVPLIIKGEPIVLMLLKMFEEKDTKNLRRYRTMNVSKELMDYMVSLTTLALIEFLNKDCKREFVNDLDLQKSQIVEVYNKVKFHNITINKDNLEKLYSLFIENYIESPTKRAYHLLPRLTLSLEVINNYFYFLFKVFNKEKEFYTLIGDKNFKSSSTIIKIIEELEIKNYR